MMIILQDHDHQRPIGTVTVDQTRSVLQFRFASGHAVTRDELFSIFGNIGFLAIEQFESPDGMRIIAGEIIEFSFSPLAGTGD